MTLKHKKIDYIKKYLVLFFPSTNYLYTKALSIAILGLCSRCNITQQLRIFLFKAHLVK